MPFVRIDEDVLAYSNKSDVVLFSPESGGSSEIGCPLEVLHDSAAIFDVALSADEEWLVSGGANREVKIWSVKDFQCVRSLTGHHGPIFSVDISTTGNTILSASRDETLKVWDFESGACCVTLHGHSQSVGCGVLFPDGTRAASGSYDKTVKIWDLRTGECLSSFEGHEGEIWDVALSPDQTKVLSASNDCTMKLWDIDLGVCVMTLSGHNSWIWSCVFDHNGLNILSASDDMTVKLWSVESGECTKSFVGHTKGVRCAVFTPTEEAGVVSGSLDETVKVWDIQTGACLRSFAAHTDAARRVCIMGDGVTFFSCSYDHTIKVWTLVHGSQITTLTDCASVVTKLEFKKTTKALIAHCENGSSFTWTNIPALAYHLAFTAALSRGSVVSKSIKLLFLGAPMAGKSALVAAMMGEALPGEDDRSVATRIHRLRMVFNPDTGYFQAVPQEESHLASLIAAEISAEKRRFSESSGLGQPLARRDTWDEKQTEIEEDSVWNDDDVELVSTRRSSCDESVSRPLSRRVSPAIVVSSCDLSRQKSLTRSTSSPSSTAYGHRSLSRATSQQSSSGSMPPIGPSHVFTETMDQARGLLESKLQEKHVDLDTFDFAGESMFDSLPALFMGSESVYLIVFDLSEMKNAVSAQQQFDHMSKWAHIIAHQVPTTDMSYFRVVLVGTHVDTFPNNTVPADLLLLTHREILRRIGAILGDHVEKPSGTESVCFFQVGSAKKIGLRDLSSALHSAVRDRQLPTELVFVQDLIGRWTRFGKIPLMSPVCNLGELALNDAPLIVLGELLPSDDAIRDGLIPYLESSADILVCRADVTSVSVSDDDVIIFDVPQLLAAVELLCSVVMAQWGRSKSKRALAMLDEVISAGEALDIRRTSRILRELDAAKEMSEVGFPFEVAEWLVWTAASKRANELMTHRAPDAMEKPGRIALKERLKPRLRRQKSRAQSAPQPDRSQLLAGADISDVPAFLASLERLSLVFRRDDRLLIPMLLPDDAPFLHQPVSHVHPVHLFLYQYVDTPTGSMMLPVSLATFHLIVVALWRESLPTCLIRATQRSTSVMIMKNCVPVQLRLFDNEPFVRVELTDDTNSDDVWRTIERIREQVCNQTRSLRWGWRGDCVFVPAHPFQADAPLFPPDKVAKSTQSYLLESNVFAALATYAHEGERLFNASLEQWWIVDHGRTSVGRTIPCVYTHAGALVVGVSRYQSTNNDALHLYADLPGVRKSVSRMAQLWGGRGFKVHTVVDTRANDVVTRREIVTAALRLAKDMGEGVGKDSLLIVQLIGHGVEDKCGGLLLSDARVNPSGKTSRFDLLSLQSLLDAEIGWRGCNILIICDFCNSGALVKNDITQQVHPPVVGYARQMISSSLDDASAFMTDDDSQTRMTELLWEALGPKLSAFRDGETVISAAELRRRLHTLDSSHSHQALLIGRVWNDWAGAENYGDVLIYRSGSGVLGSVI